MPLIIWNLITLKCCDNSPTMKEHLLRVWLNMHYCWEWLIKSGKLAQSKFFLFFQCSILGQLRQSCGSDFFSQIYYVESVCASPMLIIVILRIINVKMQ